MIYSDDWKDYELIDASLGYKYERWGNVFLLRPDPVVIWDNGDLMEKYKGKIDAIYYRSDKGGGRWENLKSVPAHWKINYKDYTFNIKQMGFKHTGLFPEQAVNWDYLRSVVKEGDNVLNLFAYTGAATVACLKAGANVVHVDSSRGMVDWAKENVIDSNCDTTKVRYIVDDVIKFVKREIRREHKYNMIIMDPPSYGRGSNGEVWSLEKNLSELISLCSELLVEGDSHLLVNSYSGLSHEVISNVVKMNICNKFGGNVSSSEIGLKCSSNDLVLPCGIYCRWER
jgi:23S rRNA (cytosine1962-C5)-methyltransferase